MFIIVRTRPFLQIQSHIFLKLERSQVVHLSGGWVGGGVEGVSGGFKYTIESPGPAMC